MTIARRKHLRLDVTPYYHCVTRCARRVFICRRDRVSGKNYSHRHAWIEMHLLLLSEVFCIDVASYAILSNHYHVVVHVDQESATTPTDLEVVERWHRLRFHRVNAASSKELNALVATISERVARYLERQCWLARDEQSDHLTLALDDEEGTTMQQLQGHTITYRIALG